ncbi:MAG: T9SS type A sorting domain-containing protein [Bacteroidales bacterium]|nr:T9SS type A sorting domain-containing protein [Bacteroidales bacterium]
MKKGAIILLLLFISSTLFSQQEAYSFFAAGHLYGAPGVENIGFHPPFKAKFDYIQGREEIEFGVLLGDIVIYGTQNQWGNVVADIDTLGLPCYIAVGNHDMYNPEFYFAVFGDTTYYSFSYKNDLFIILDPNIDNWNISGDQLSFLQNTLNIEAPNHHNVFVMMHQVLWWAPDNKYSGIVLNSTEGRDSEMNFWTEIEPLFHELENNVVMLAGDVGAASYASPFMYDKYDNITFVATGMGKGDTDNFVVVNVDENKNVGFELICLSGDDLYCFGDLTDYSISGNNDIIVDNSFVLYPNPAQDKLNIENLNDRILVIEIYSDQGQLVFKQTCSQDLKLSINTSELSQGLYIIKLITDKGVISQRFVKTD